jgi:dTMP kinase
MALVTIEGIDGSGKTSLWEALGKELEDLEPVMTREPGVTWIGEAVRRAIAERADPVAEALLFAADHAAHLATVVRPALARGRLVISDRYTDSRFAYQAVTLKGILPEPLPWLRSLHDGWTITPDRTFLLALPVEEALNRIRTGRKREHFEDPAVLEQVQKNYLMLAEEDGSRFVIIDAGKEKEEILSFVAQQIRAIAESRKNRSKLSR